MNISRRQFLATALMGAGVIGAGALAWHFMPSRKHENRKSNTLENKVSVQEPKPQPKLTFPPEWSFLESWTQETITDDVNKFVKTHVPLNAPLALPEDSPELRSIQPALVENLRLRLESLNIKMNEMGTITRQDFGTPIRKEQYDAYLSYARKAFDFMHENIKGLNPIKPAFTEIQQGQDFSKNFNGNAYFSQGYHKLYGVSQQHGDQLCTAHTVYPVQGSQVYFKLSRDGANIMHYYVTLSTGEIALASIFSEVLPLTTLKVSYPHVQRKGFDEAITADETLVEAISHCLVKELAEKLNIPNRDKIILNSLPDTNLPQYRFIRQALPWVEKNGVQKAFDFYMDRPEKFMNEIR